jgi:hypothetical protein
LVLHVAKVQNSIGRTIADKEVGNHDEQTVPKRQNTTTTRTLSERQNGSATMRQSDKAKKLRQVFMVKRGLRLENVVIA